jgi:hypothetical protein
MNPVFRLAFFFLVLSFTENALGEDLSLALYREVIAVGRQCAQGKSGSQVIPCYVRASPKKCEKQVYEALSKSPDGWYEAHRPWAYCIASCIDAGFLSRTLGECRRELK